ncbi:hypothetical protein AURDEDRAFT_175035 [Auricularia subglabra TFB-10046 SS5]|nr:hypothetical protein AURDEDRAFT_175035 [Auricularia subglabra TFB-10046 SS5]
MRGWDELELFKRSSICTTVKFVNYKVFVTARYRVVSRRNLNFLIRFRSAFVFALAACFLQAVTVQTNRGSAQPLAPAFTVEKVAGPLQVLTNWASFVNILVTPRAVAVCSTITTCSPCKTIKSLFYELAEAKLNPGMVLVKVS